MKEGLGIVQLFQVRVLFDNNQFLDKSHRLFGGFSSTEAGKIVKKHPVSQCTHFLHHAGHPENDCLRRFFYEVKLELLALWLIWYG